MNVRVRSDRVQTGPESGGAGRIISAACRGTFEDRINRRIISRCLGSARLPEEVLGLYAIVKSGGKQVRVEPGKLVDLEKLPEEVGAKVELSEVLVVGGEEGARIGQPLVFGAVVRATVVAQGKRRKVLVFHYKAKKNIRKRRGHRQPFTTVRIDGIEVANA